MLTSGAVDLATRPKLFIGSSNEGLRYAKALGELLAERFETRLWNEGVFRASQSGLDALLVEAATVEFAAFVLTADDSRTSRGRTAVVARDNVLFELGMFLGQLGAGRVFFVVPKQARLPFELPTDLHGITEIRYAANRQYKRQMRGVTSELLANLEQHVLPALPLETTLNARVDVLLNDCLSKVRSFLPDERTLGMHVFRVRGGGDHARLVRVARRRIDDAPTTEWVFKRGEGVAGAAWDRNASVVLDLSRQVYRSCSSPSEWVSVSAEDKLGMDYDLLSETKRRFRLVSATPVHDPCDPQRDFLGCVTLNVGSDSRARARVLSTDSTRSQLFSTASQIGLLLGGSRA